MTKICQKLVSYNNGWFNGNIIWIALALFCISVAVINVSSLSFCINRSAKKFKQKAIKIVVWIIIGAVPAYIGSNNIKDYNSKLMNEISSKSELVKVKSQNNTFFFENIKQKNNEVIGKPVFKITHKTGFLGIKETETNVGGSFITITGNTQIARVNARKTIKENFTDSF